MLSNFDSFPSQVDKHRHFFASTFCHVTPGPPFPQPPFLLVPVVIERPLGTLIRLTLKNVSKTWELEFAKRIKDKNVLNPPLRTAGPIYLRDFFARSKRVPIKRRILSLNLMSLNTLSVNGFKW